MVAPPVLTGSTITSMVPSVVVTPLLDVIVTDVAPSRSVSVTVHSALAGTGVPWSSSITTGDPGVIVICMGKPGSDSTVSPPG